MYEGLILLCLVVGVVVLIRPKKDGCLDAPVVIRRSGVYHATLAPQLVRAQLFLEIIIDQLAQDPLPAGDIDSQFFLVRDEVGAYLLAVGRRGDVLYFQAILPLLNETDTDVIRQFSGQVMVNLKMAVVADEQVSVQLRTAVQNAASDVNNLCSTLGSA